MITGQTFIKRFEAFCPLELAESGDPVGLHIGTLNKPIQRVMMTLDVRPAVVQEAIDKNIDLIVAKHPPIFRKIGRLTTDDFQTNMYADLLKHDIAVYAAHTNMDIIENGLNDWFCDALGAEPYDYIQQTHSYPYSKVVVYTPKSAVEDVRQTLMSVGAGQYGEDYDGCSFTSEGTGRFRPIHHATPHIGQLNILEAVPEEKIETIILSHQVNEVLKAVSAVHPYEEPAFDVFELSHLTKDYGIGRMATLPEAMPLTDFIDLAKQVFKVDHLRLVTDRKDKMIKTIAICGGSGEKFYREALKKGADVYITGDVYYHTAHDMIEDQLTVLDPGHYIEELCKEKFVELFNEWKEENQWDVSFFVSETDTNPFEII